MNTSEKEGYCANCKQDKWSNVKIEYRDHSGIIEGGIWFEKVHRVLECKSCKTTFYQREDTCSEEMDQGYNYDGTTYSVAIPSFVYMPPRPKRNRPNWEDHLWKKDADLANIFSELYAAYDNGLAILTAIGIRTAFDRLTEHLGIDPTERFGEKLSLLLEQGTISQSQKNELAILIDAGSAAAHRGWEPSESELGSLLLFLEFFTEKALFPEPSIAHLRRTIPPKPAKKSAKK
ncbi:hypothetical protein CLH39_11920 [Alcaligenes faecalis]|uniref:DUF4145 domain-containing protein n=1 Tax=Alcaligenes faecalis TaxID=511 RepID=UPI001931D002|nr:DUF4145 domain-containing protein [Alcaligenes faecalis]QRF90896.1 hypothetical protein CLH39_11920 [Alcaligenes faecalis]